MAGLNLPQNDEQTKRKQELTEQAKFYTYNNDIGIPLIHAEGTADKSKADWQVKILTTLIKLRINLQAIYDKTGLDFTNPKPVRDVPKLIGLLKSGGNPVDYFTPDPGFIKGDVSLRRPSSINDYVDKIFVDHNDKNLGTAPVPEIAAKWDSDETFAYNFLAGPNPNQLRRYTMASKPGDFDITSLDLGSLPGFSGDSIKTAIESGRVYFVDHSDIKELFANLPDAPAPNASHRTFNGIVSDDWKYTYAPYAAFALPPGGSKLLPIAIQCGPKAEGNQIYTPKDGYSWKMARICVLAAHNNHHEVITHLGLTHLYVDAIVMATRLHLHPNHPVNRLLSPHFEGTASINIGARTSLIMPEKSVDRLVGSKIEMNYPYLKKHRLSHSFRNNFLRNRFNSFGVSDTKLLPNYPYRDDALLIWDAVHSWVSDYIAIWYKSEADLRADFEIQNWANEINGKGQIPDFCKTGGGVQSRDELIDLLTMTIFTAGPQHAAVNFTQGIEMLHVPTNPLAGYSQAPKGLGHTEKDFLNILPPLDVAIHTWAILNLLAGINNTRLGDYRGNLLIHPASELARLKFSANLKVVEGQITSANNARRSLFGLEYVHLLPSRIPASINI
ncbi:MAG: lipoxygenase family protein [Proteobacteria bacterium]|nr:lipoxygenase family protein [Pseudomonadota bacterium]